MTMTEELEKRIREIQTILQNNPSEVARQKLEQGITYVANALDELTQRLQEYQPFWQEELQILAQKVRNFLPFSELGETQRKELNRLLTQIRHFLQNYIEQSSEQIQGVLNLFQTLEQDLKRLFM
jgi:ABC-type transporter Mla subunit MlaD